MLFISNFPEVPNKITSFYKLKTLFLSLLFRQYK